MQAGAALKAARSRRGREKNPQKTGFARANRYLLITLLELLEDV
jgi:hypothetical protein